jgi:hypothetical protein
MTTRSQVAANRANARNSTGPTSASGKAASAQNARTHGLTTPPDGQEVTRWFQIIMEDAEATVDPLSADPVARAALSLAEAEAARDRATRAEADHLTGMLNRALRRSRRSLDDIADLDLDDVATLDFLIRQPVGPDMRAMLRLMKRLSPHRPAAEHKTLDRLSGYRRAAEGRRRRALRAWIELRLKSKNSKTNPKTT